MSHEGRVRLEGCACHWVCGVVEQEHCTTLACGSWWGRAPGGSWMHTSLWLLLTVGSEMVVTAHSVSDWLCWQLTCSNVEKHL